MLGGKAWGYKKQGRAAGCRQGKEGIGLSEVENIQNRGDGREEDEPVRMKAKRK